MTAIERADDELTRLRAQVRFLESELADRDRLIASLRYNAEVRGEVIDYVLRQSARETRALRMFVTDHEASGHYCEGLDAAWAEAKAALAARGTSHDVAA